jgi:putative peptidoglycan lipid II flippase
LTLPSTVGLILLRRPVVEMFFQRGSFDQQDVAMVAWALAWYAVGLVAHSQLEIVTRAFYALHDTTTPVLVGGGAMALNVICSLAFSRLFAWVGARYAAAYQPWMPLGGLALANSAATILETVTLTTLLHRRLGQSSVGSSWASTWRIALSAVFLAGVLLAFLQLAPTQNPWILGSSGAALGAATFVLATILLRSPEPAIVVKALFRCRSR